jgi:hypothetical protein
MNRTPNPEPRIPMSTRIPANPRADGTTNFVHGFPYACISLGLLDQRVPVLGVIYNPFLDHLYTGVRGAGSYLHSRPSPANNGSLRRCAAPPPRARQRPPTARARRRARRGRVGLGPRAGPDPAQGGQLCAPRGRAAARRHGALAALRRERRAQLCACRAGRAGHVLVRRAASAAPPLFFFVSWALTWSVVVVGGRTWTCHNSRL